MALLAYKLSTGPGHLQLTHMHLGWLMLVLWPLTVGLGSPVVWAPHNVAVLMSVPSLRL